MTPDLTAVAAATPTADAAALLAADNPLGFGHFIAQSDGVDTSEFVVESVGGR